MAISSMKRRWPGARVPYAINKGLPNQARIKAAVAHWNAKTNIVLFEKKKFDVKDYVEFQESKENCLSFVGRKGKKQTIDLAVGCLEPAVIHEIGHAIGLHHEHRRPDRDAYVTVTLAQVEPTKKHNFRKLPSSQVVTSSAYDYRSIMHYRRRSFPIGNQDTLASRVGGQILDSSKGLTAADVTFVNGLYPVAGKGPGDRAAIKARVIHNIAVLSGFDEAAIREPHSLYVHLLLSKDQRGALAPGFRKIADDTNPSALITKKECKKLKTVKACIDLVHKRS